MGAWGWGRERHGVMGTGWVGAKGAQGETAVVKPRRVRGHEQGKGGWERYVPRPLEPHEPVLRLHGGGSGQEGTGDVGPRHAS
jgi:hypothetical protein